MTDTIRRRLRANPPSLGIIPESVVFGNSDIRQRKDHWEAADGPPSSADFDFLADGGLVLKATNGTVLDSSTNDGYLHATDKRRTGDFPVAIASGFPTVVRTHRSAIFACAKVVWGGTEDQDMEIQNIRAYLNPDTSGLGPLPVWYELHLYAGSTLSGDAGSALTLTEICSPKKVIAPQTAGTVTFDFSDRAERPKPKLYGLAMQGGPWMYIEIRPLDGQGNVVLSSLSTTITSAGTTATATTASPHGLQTGAVATIAGAAQAAYNGTFIVTVTGATTYTYTMGAVAASPATGTITSSFASTGWARNSAAASLNTAGNILTSVRLNTYDQNDHWAELDLSKVPYVRIQTGTYTAKTITFSGANVLDLSGAPGTNDVEFVAQGDEPGTTSILYEVSDDAGANWYAFTDGMLAVTNLPNVSKQQTYSVRATLNPGSGGSSTPTLRGLGVHYLATKFFHELATVSGDQGYIDPPTLKGKIGEITIRAIKDGAADYQDAITDLLAENDMGDIQWRIWIGPIDPHAEPRATVPDAWMLIDTYIMDDYECVDGGAIDCICLSSLSLLKAPLPVRDPGTGERQTYQQTEELLTTVYEDLRDGQLAVAGRNVGQGPVDDALTRVSNIIEASGDSEAKAEMDALLALIGWGHIGSQGKLKAVDMMGKNKATRAVFGREDVKWEFVSPGYRNRITEFVVPYDYEQESGQFLREVFAENGPAVTRLGTAKIDQTANLDDIVARWVHSVAVTSLTRAGSTATVTTFNDHGLQDGDLVSIIGAIQDEYNIDSPPPGVVVTGPDTFTYEVSGTPASPATGTITCAILPHRIANRTIQAFGTGLIILNFTTPYAYSELEVGDLISIETDRFVMRDPTAENRQLRGVVNMLAVIQAVRDIRGTKFGIWVQSPANIIPTTTTGSRTQRIASAKVYRTGDLVVGAGATENVEWDAEAYDRGDLHDTGSNPELLTVGTGQGGRYLIVARVQFASRSGATFVGLWSSALGDVIQGQDFLDGATDGEFTLTATVEDVKPGDYFYLYAQADLGSGITLKCGSEANTSLSMTRSDGGSSLLRFGGRPLLAVG